MHLYEDCGTDCFAHLNGMFAIASGMHRKARFVLGRDRLGQKPLVYRDEPQATAICQRTEEPAAGPRLAAQNRSRPPSTSI